MDDINLKKTGEELNPSDQNIDPKFGQRTNLLIDLTKNLSPPPEPKNFGHPAEDTKYDLDKKAEIEEKKIKEKRARAERRLSKKNIGKGDDYLDQIIKEMNAEEQRDSELLEYVLKLGILKSDWLKTPNNQVLKMHELASTEDLDDYRSRVDISTYIDFPVTKSNPAEKIFIGFDATMSTSQKVLKDKLTRSTNVSRENRQEKKLPFGFSTLRYTYDPSTNEKLLSDKVPRYTICLSKKLLDSMKEFSQPDKQPELNKSAEYQEIRFKILSEIYEQNRFFKLMNQGVNVEASRILTRISTCVWKSLKDSMIDLINHSDSFSDLKSSIDKIKTLEQSKKTASPATKDELAGQIKSSYAKLYEEISERYFADDHTRNEPSYKALISAVREFDRNAAEGILDKYKAPQVRNVSFDPNGNTFTMKEWYGKTDYQFDEPD
ncbi:hypothetical protein IKG48_01820 [Candidatus Saccharibacteria bacterium]|nr:hypothetical protein [Candidatus Saccharibacteria bacterium]